MRKTDLFVSILILLMICSSTQGQTVNSTTSQLQFKDLKLQVVIPRITLLPLEPIPLIIKLKNSTNQPILGHKSIGFSSHKIHFYVRKNGGQQVKIFQLTPYLELVGVQEFEIQPGESFQTQELLSYGISDYFSEPGNYEIQAVLVNNAKSQTKSDAVHIRLIEPTGSSRAVYELIKKHPSGHSLFDSIEFKNSKGLLEIIANQYFDSGYAESAYFALGEGYFAQKQYTEAETYLNKLKNDESSVFSQKANTYLKAIQKITAPALINPKPQ